MDISFIITILIYSEQHQQFAISSPQGDIILAGDFAPAEAPKG